MTTPAGRYKVEERGRRLVTIDTLTGEDIGGVGGSAGDHAPLEAPRPTVFPTRQSPTAGPGRATGLSAGATRADGPPTGAAGASPSDWFTTVAALCPGAEARPGGIILLTTSARYDDAAPRLLALSDRGKVLLGVSMLILFALILIAIIIAMVWSPLVLLFIGFILLRSGSAILKPLFGQIIADASPGR